MNHKQVREALRKGKIVRYINGICKRKTDPAIVRVEYGRLKCRRWCAFYIDETGDCHMSDYSFVRDATYIAEE